IHSLRRVSQDGSGPPRFAVNVPDRRTVDAVATLPFDGEIGIGPFDKDGFGIPFPCKLRGKPILFIEQPGIPRLRREEDKLPDSNDSSVASGCATLNVAYLIGETKILAVNHALARSALDGSSRGCHGAFSPSCSAIFSCSFITA